jgi:release factor glutamine methyltransferase
VQTVKQTLDQAAKQCLLISETPLLDAEVLLAHVLNVQRSHLHAYPERILSDEEKTGFYHLIEKRTQGQPIPYLTGHCEFWSLDFTVTPDTLVPRQETELLVELILRKFNKPSCLAADLGTGSGAIALALAYERPQWIIHATDLSQAALNIAKINASRLKTDNVFFHQGFWCKALPTLSFDFIVSNPPYIAQNDPHLKKTVLATEPASALLSDHNGLKDIQHLIQEAKVYLKPGGYLWLEHGFSQAESVRNSFLEAGYAHIVSYKDFLGLDRVTTGVFGIE